MEKNNSYKKQQKSKYEDIFFADIALIIAKHIKFITVTPIIFTTGMIIYVLFIAEPTYQSVAKIMSSSTSVGSQATGLAAQLGITLGRPTETKWVYTEILKSRTLAHSMLDRKFDTRRYGNSITLYEILMNEENDRNEILEIKAVNKFLKLVSVSEDKATGIFTLRLDGFEPQFAVDITNALIDQLVQHQKLYNKKKTNKSRNFIDERIVETKKELNKSEENLKDFIDRNRRIENSPSLQLERERLAREVSVLNGVFTTLKQQLETLKIQQVKEEDYVLILDKPEIPLRPSKPQKTLLTLTSGLFGFIMGLIFIFVKELLANQNNENKQKIYSAKTIAYDNIRKIIKMKT